MLRKELKDYFDQIEGKIEPIDEYQLGGKIGGILKIKQEKITDKEEIAEYIAFEFEASYTDKETGWGGYYGPKFVLPNKQGQVVEFPSIQQIDEEIINYWKKRANESMHPILSCRYADLVFDFEPIVLKKNIDFTMAQKVIDSTLDICDKSLEDGLGCKSKLERSLSLAIQINDSVRISKLKEMIIKTEFKFAEDDKPGIWGYAFKWLVLENSDKVLLSEDEKKKLVTDLELRLDRLMTVEDPNPWHVEFAVKLLAEYYVKNEDEENLKKVLDKLELAFRKNKHSNSDGMLINNYLEKLIEIYLKYSFFQFAKQANERIMNELSNLGDKGKFATKQISAEVTIKNEDINNFIKSIFGENNSEQLEKIIFKLAVNFILRKKSVEDQLKDLSQNHPISYLASHVIASEDGYPIAKFGPISDEYDKHLLANFSRNLHFQSFFLRIAFNELKTRYTVQKTLDILLLSPVFRAEDRDYILKLLKSFWDNDYLTCCCLSIPLIEDAIRNLFRINSRTYIKSNDDGGYDVLNLDRLLGSGLIKDVYQTLGEDVEYYFKVLLTERIGWNLRNNFAHGINKKLFESEDVASRLVHVLICLSLVRDNKDTKNKSKILKNK